MNSRAFAAGVFAAFLMSLLMGAGVWLHLSSISFESSLGRAVTGSSGAGSWLLGFLLHLFYGGIFGIIYGFVFRALGATGAAVGGVVGFFHWLAAGTALSLLISPAHREFWAILDSPNFFGSLLLHLTYGAIVGGLYRTGAQSKATREAVDDRRRAA